MWQDHDLVAAALFVVAFLFVRMLIPIVVLGFKHARHTRELEHAERIKALEIGRPLAGDVHDEPWSQSSRIAMSIGAGVPIGIFAAASFTSLAVGYHEAIWIASAMVGTAGVICGSILAAQSHSSHARAGRSEVDKPYTEADAYDVVAARG